MRYLATPEFADKVGAIKQLLWILPHIQRAVARIESSDRGELLQEATSSQLVAESGVYVLRSGPVLLFFSMGSDDVGDYVLLLDVAVTSDRPLPATPSVVLAPTLDPRTNTTINPRYNTTLNPRYNTTINPQYNTTLNPKYNTTLNPEYNTTLNPRYNTTLNPNYNTTLNPRFNTTLNPRYNPAYGGPFLFSVDGSRAGFFVRGSDQVLIQFSEDAKFIGLAVRNHMGGYALFDSLNKWVGYLVPTLSSTYLQFSVDGEWVGFTA